MAKPVDKSMFGGLSKEDRKLLTDLKSGFGEQKKALQVLAQSVSALSEVVGQGKPIDVRFSWPFDNELMQLVKKILALLESQSGDIQPAIDAVNMAFAEVKSAVEGITTTKGE